MSTLPKRRLRRRAARRSPASNRCARARSGMQADRARPARSRGARGTRDVELLAVDAAEDAACRRRSARRRRPRAGNAAIADSAQVLGPHAVDDRLAVAAAARWRGSGSRDAAVELDARTRRRCARSVAGQEVHRRRADEAGDERGWPGGRRARAAIADLLDDGRRASRRSCRPSSSPRSGRA